MVSSGPHNKGVSVTNDGATILKAIGVDNPAAKVLVGESDATYTSIIRTPIKGTSVIRTSVSWDPTLNYNANKDTFLIRTPI